MHIRLRNSSPGVAICTILLAAIAALPAAAQDQTKSLPLFDDQEILRVRLEAPFTTIMRNRDSDEYHAGFLYLTDATAPPQTLDLKLRARGNFRGKAEHCHFAPLRLNFRRKQVRGTVFEGQDKLKLVTHCENFGSAYEQSLLLEYLAYRILNQLTDLSFRVRLLHVDYIDTEQDNKSRRKYAFLIEDEDELARRIRLQRTRVEAVTAEQLHPGQTALISVFQYLIGNTDFSAVRGAADATCCHNALLFTGPDGDYLPVAYDFDLAGLVDAPYAAPNPALKIKDVKDRLYRGFCSYNDQLEIALQQVAEQRSDIALLIDSQEGLTKASRRTASRYIAKYFDRVSDQRGIERNLLKECS